MSDAWPYDGPARPSAGGQRSGGQRPSGQGSSGQGSSGQRSSGQRSSQQAASGERGSRDPARDAILHAAATLATADGLERLSIGSLAAALGMSKSRLAAHFGSKQQLQLATVQEAARIFAEEVVEPALAAAPGLDQLTAVCEAFFCHVERRTSPGGCFMAGAALEMGNRPGPLREVIDEFQARFGALLRGFAATAVYRNELAADENPDRLAFELNGIMLAADTNFVLHDDPAVLDLARQIVHQRLGVTG